MSHVNKQSPDALIARIEELEAQLSQATSHINSLQKTEANLRSRKTRFGLVWEDQSEEIDVDLETKAATLKEVKKLAVKPGEGGIEHLLIEGDNLQALTALQFSHHKKIDVIYIDPPYNTGKEFIYNDKCVGTKDTWRHSKWLSFMDKRLRLAKNLIADTGLIFISIDDHEFAHLKLLSDQIFGESNFATVFSWIQASRDLDDYDGETEVPTVGANLGDFKGTHEYVLCYRGSRKARLGLLPTTKEFVDSRLTKNGNARSTLLVPAGTRCEAGELYLTGSIGGASERIDIVSDAGLKVQNNRLVHDVELESGWGSAGLARKFFAGQKVVDKKGQEVVEIFLTASGLPYMRKKSSGELASNVLSGYGDTSNHTNLLKRMVSVEEKFHPKPVAMIKKLIQLGSSSKDAVVLDFFAGSGTTAHAVAELNTLDGGNRQSISVTSNENNIAVGVTQPRIKAALTGKFADGSAEPPLDGSLRYLKCGLTSLPKSRPAALQKTAMNSLTLISLREGVYTVVASNSKNWAVLAEDDKVVISWNLWDTSELYNTIRKHNHFSEKVAYVLCEDSSLIDDLASEFPDWRFERPPDAKNSNEGTV